MSEVMLIIAKVATPIAAKAATSGFRRATLNLGVAWRARSACRRLGLPVPALWKLRRYLARGDVLSAFASGLPERLERLTDQVAKAPLGDRWMLEGAQSEQFVEVLLSSYTRSLRGNEATEVQVRTAIAELKQFLGSRDDAASEAEFDLALASIPPALVDEARALRRSWPAIRRFVVEYAAAIDQRQAMKDWTASRPTWMAGAPTAALVWLAELAEASHLRTETIIMLSEALAAGATPAPFWRVRLALLRTGETAEAQRGALEPLAESHPAAAALLSFLDRKPDEALQLLDRWQPSSEHEKSFRMFLLCQVQVAAGQWDAAAQLVEAELARGSSEPAQYLSDRLFERGSRRTSRFDTTQLEAALALAIRVRDHLRTWGGPSAAAVLTAMKSAELLGDGARAWSLTQPGPSGEATQEEATTPEVQERALLVAAMVRPLAEAGELIGAATDSLVRVQAQALLAERRGETDAAVTLWRAAIVRAQDPQDLVRAGYQLARHGEFSPELSRARDSFPKEVEELRLLAGLNAGIPGELEVLRGTASTSKPLTFGLVSHLQRTGDHHQAGKVAAAGADRWSDPDLWLTAAQEYSEAGELEEATDAARTALQTGGQQWADALNAHLVLIEALTALGRWSEAADASATAFARFPESPSTCWALAMCQLKLGRNQDSWTTLTILGKRPAPRNEQEAAVMIRLLGEFDSSEAAVEQILALGDQWPDSREVKLAVVYALIFLSVELSERVQGRVRSRVTALMPSSLMSSCHTPSTKMTPSDPSTGLLRMSLTLRSSTAR